MKTAIEYADEAELTLERLSAAIEDAVQSGLPVPQDAIGNSICIAQVYATLALAAANR